MKTDEYGVFRFEVEYDFHRVVVEMRGDSTVTDVVEQFKAFLLAAGFHPDNVNEALGEEVYLSEKDRVFRTYTSE